MERRVALTAVLGVHLLVALAHGLTHSLVPVWLPAWQNALVVITTFVGPVVGVALAWRGHWLGVPLFTVSMVGALLTGGLLHFLLENPDNLAAIPVDPWRFPFRASAVTLAAVQAAGVILGGRYWLDR